MNKFLMAISMLVFSTTFLYAQTAPHVFYNGEIPDSMQSWAWGYTDDVAVGTPVPNIGYSPGTSALKWGPANDMGWQGLMMWLTDYQTAGIDMSSIWSTDSLYFKMRAPNGLEESIPELSVLLYDPVSDLEYWDNTAWYTLDNFHSLNDGNWHQFAIALSDFQVWTTPIDQTNITAVSFEYFDTNITMEVYFDEIWVGNSGVRQQMTIFNGNDVMPNLTSYYRWGFQDGTFVISDDEGFTPGTNAIVWENNQDLDGGLGFEFELHDLTYTWTVDTLKLKVKAPAGINDLKLVWWDWNLNTIEYVIDASVVTWDGTWKSLEVAFTDFPVNESFDKSIVYALTIQPATAPIAERILFDDIWTGSPIIDIVAPAAPGFVNVDVSTPYINVIAPENIASESGETYNIYYSLNPITNLENENVLLLESKVAESDNLYVTHNLTSPLNDGEVIYYYAATSTDAAGNSSESFIATESFTNTAKGRAVINFGAPTNFVADGELSEWDGIVPFNIHPNRNWFEGEIDDSLDCSLNLYLAMDAENLYVYFDVFDDAYTWDENNTSPWWDDESIEFFIGLYDIIGDASHHSWWERSPQPDYRLVFLPDKYLSTTNTGSGPEDTVLVADENYYFADGGVADYFIEAKIPFAKLASLAGDDLFTPVEGMKIPIEIQINDNDVADGGWETINRMQFGNNSNDSPWHTGPSAWSHTWIGVPDVSAIGDDAPTIINKYYLRNNFPNPFNPSTTIEYSTALTGNVKIEVYNTIGQNVATLINKHQQAGQYKVNFDASNLTSGIYYYKITTKKFTQVKKMLLLK